VIAALVMAASVRGEDTSARIDALFAEWDRPDSPGCALGVVRDGDLVHARGYGMANLEHSVPISTGTVFRTGSVGKQFTAFAVLLAEAAGKLSLDDDIRDYLPELRGIEAPITVRHLVHHSSGLRDYLDLMYLAGFRDEAHYDNEQVLEVLAGQATLNFPPGTDYLYSNTGYFLLSQIIERSTGKSLRDWSAEAMFGPLRMTSTHFHDDPWMVVPKRAYGYSRREDGDGFRVNMTTLEMVGDGGVFTTIEDLVAWERNFLEPDVGGQELLEKRLTPGVLIDGTEQVYAAGLSVREYRGLPAVQHGGAFVGFRAGMVRLPEERFAVYCLCNVGEASPMDLAFQVVDFYLADRLATEEPEPQAVRAGELSSLVGHYASHDTVWVIEVVPQDDGSIGIDLGGSVWKVAAVEDGSGEYVLVREGGRRRLVVERSVDGPAKLTIPTAGRRPWVFERVESVPPSADALAEYVGRYHSGELDVTWEIVVDSDRLIARLPPLDDVVLEPRYADAFTWDGGHAVFERGAGGAIEAMLFGTERARRLEMVRLEGE
jgi:CubicO group peptidase (beta-lactamase class C family)